MATTNRRDRRLAAAKTRRTAAAKSPAGSRGSPNNPQQDRLGRALMLAHSGRLRDAFDAFLAAVGPKPREVVACAAFGNFLVANLPAQPHPDVDAVFIAALDEAWIRPDALAVPVVRYLTTKSGDVAATLLPANPAIMLQDPGVRQMLGDPLLIALLRATPAATPRLDVFLARCRRAALATGLAGDDLNGLMPFLSALAERSANSGFALTLPHTADDRPHVAAEAADLVSLREAISAGPDRHAAVPALALLGTYESLRGAVSPALDDPALVAVRAAHVDEPAREAVIAAALEPLTLIDTSNDAVRGQYEIHPYPMWVREPVGVPVAVSQTVSTLLRQRRGGLVKQVLVAGCGTGQHALAAADRWPKAQVLAIDISRASLAYAVRKVEALRIERVTFGLADLLQVGALGRRFDVIESMGVLHHLADPAAGLAALVDVLEPGGVMFLGLYSRAARQGLAAARKLAGATVPVTAEALRDFRAAALAELDAPEILFSPDFYSIGGCRDLVFHAREQSYDIAEIVDLLAGAGLELVAIETPAQVPAVIGPAVIVKVPQEQDWRGWAAAEREHPTLFGGMYQFWARHAA